MKIAITNIGTIVSGDWRQPFVSGDSILMEDGLIASVGTMPHGTLESCDLVVDAMGTTACPGLIDSHMHISFGDYSPKQRTVGYLESYTHGGTTTALSAGEIHIAGRPKDPNGVKALAIIAHKCFENFRPAGMRVHAGTVLLEPTLTPDDFVELRQQGLWLAKVGFGSVETPYDYVPIVKAARDAGFIVNVHCGGASISLANSITGDHLLAMKAHVAFHVNGGPIAMPDEDYGRLIKESDMALQIAQAGNIRTSLLCLNLVVDNRAFDRFLISTDTPTGTGVIPLGMIKTVTEMATLSDHPAEWMLAAATGNVARTFKLNSGFLQKGKDADVLLVDAPMGGVKKTCLEALKNGDVWSLVGVFTQGVPRFIGRSRNTPPPIRTPKVTVSRITNDFAVAQQLG